MEKVIQSIVSKVSQSIGSLKGQFKQAANDSNKNISFISKDLGKHFASQQNKIASLSNSIEEIENRSQQTASKIDSTNNLIRESISIQNDILSTLKSIIKNVDKISDSNHKNSSLLSDLATGAVGGAALYSYFKNDGSTTQSDKKGVGETGSSSEALQFFESKGWTKEQSAGIVGNLQAESGKNLKTDSIGDGGKAYGIAQWHPDRQEIFKKNYGKDIRESNFKEQLEFVNWELNNTEKKAGALLKAAKDASEAANIIDKHYERSAGLHREQRIANAKALIGNEDKPKKESQDASVQTNNQSNSLIKSGEGEGEPTGTGEQTSSSGELQKKQNGGNGNLDPSSLQDIGGSHKLQPAAAQAYLDMVAAAKQEGISWSITESYRTLDQQVKVAREKGLYSQGGLAAEPGRSNHGWGTALDLGGGANKEGSKENEWLQKNAGRFGFANIPKEPWHWEYRGGGVEKQEDRSSGGRYAQGAGGFGGQDQSLAGMYNQALMGLYGGGMNQNMGMMAPMDPFTAIGGMLGGGKGAAIGSLAGAAFNLIGGGQQNASLEPRSSPNRGIQKPFIPNDDSSSSYFLQEDARRKNQIQMIQQAAQEKESQREQPKAKESPVEERGDFNNNQNIQTAQTDVNPSISWAEKLMGHFDLGDKVKTGLTSYHAFG